MSYDRVLGMFSSRASMIYDWTLGQNVTVVDIIKAIAETSSRCPINSDYWFSINLRLIYWGFRLRAMRPSHLSKQINLIDHDVDNDIRVYLEADALYPLHGHRDTQLIPSLNGLLANSYTPQQQPNTSAIPKDYRTGSKRSSLGWRRLTLKTDRSRHLMLSIHIYSRV